MPLLLILQRLDPGRSVLNPEPDIMQPCLQRVPADDRILKLVSTCGVGSLSAKSLWSMAHILNLARKKLVKIDAQAPTSGSESSARQCKRGLKALLTLPAHGMDLQVRLG